MLGVMKLDDEIELKLKWSDFPYYDPIRIIITNWKNLKTLFAGRFMVVPCAMEYKNRKVSFCIPYSPFVRRLRLLPVKQQRMIIGGKAVIELVKTYKSDSAGDYGMKILKVEPYAPP